MFLADATMGVFIIQGVTDHPLVQKHGNNIQKLLTVLIYYIVGALFFCNVEGWTIIQSIYFTTVTITTVGYGDFSPSTMGGARPSPRACRARDAPLASRKRFNVRE